MVAILLACLISAPTDCRTVELILTETMPVPQAIEAQTRAAEWLAKHPGMVSHGVKIVQGRAA